MTRIFTLLLLLSTVFIHPLEAQSKWPASKTDTLYFNDLPTSFENYKVLFISDIHYGPFLSARRLGKVIQAAKSKEADILILGGDYVYLKEKYFYPCFDSLAILAKEYKTYGVLGNHDHWENAKLCSDLMAQAGIKNITNKGYWIYKGHDSIRLGGVDDLWEGRQIINNALKSSKDSNFIILVSHNPDYIEYVKRPGIDLMLSGHTHGGQIRFGKWAPFVPSHFDQKYISGIYRHKQTTLLVSNGIGKVIVPLRIGAPAQINLLVLKKNPGM